MGGGAGVLAAEPVSFRRHLKNNIKLELVFSLRSLAELLRFATSTFIFRRSPADLLGFAILPLPFLTCVLNKNALATKEARRTVNARRKAIDKKLLL